MSNDKMREEFEQSPRFRGMDFQRAPEAPDYYLSPYANGAWDGWKASRAAVVDSAAPGDLLGDAIRIEKENDQLKAEVERQSGLLARMVDQYVPLTDLEGVPGWSRVVELVELVAERDRLLGEVEVLRQALTDCSDSLHAEMLQKFGGQLPDDMHPVTRRNYDRDIAEVAGYRAVIGGVEPSLDTLHEDAAKWRTRQARVLRKEPGHD